METALMHNPADFWRAALTSDVSLWCAAMGLATLLLATVCVRAMIRRGRLTRRRVSLWADADGTATVEFALIMPILLFTVLMLTQTTTLMGGNLFVHYAAFAATRSAVVQIPQQTPDCAANVYFPNTSKHEAILRTAVYALVPVGGPWSSGGNAIPPEPYVAAMNRFFEGYGQQPPAWVQNIIGQRVAYASANTSVEVLRAIAVDTQTVRLDEVTDGQFGPKDAVAVRVAHRLNLRMPYVNRIFADGSHPDGRGRYMNVTAYAVLSSEGLLDRLPDPPTLPRIDR